MSIDLIQKRLKYYNLPGKESELNAIKEIFQEIALCALARTDFFKNAAFMGGTCLRILHCLPRFSEERVKCQM
jgi:predicted nucleotidyltransferase component of viral defense system